MKILKNITTVLSVLTGVYILHAIILPTIFKETYVKYILDIVDWFSNITSSDSYSSHTIMIHVDNSDSVLQIILPIIIFAVLIIFNIRLRIKIKNIKK